MFLAKSLHRRKVMSSNRIGIGGWIKLRQLNSDVGWSDWISVDKIRTRS
ncbi:Uncharacterised protein [Vibrio cholerae]|nr:Uncharacterised protein [Vibrio cholerae]